MTVTLATALTAVRERLDESVPRQWSDPALRRWLMEGAREVARRTEALFGQQDIAVTANTAEYTLPTASGIILRIHMAEWIPGDGRLVPLLSRTREAMAQVWGQRQAQVSGTPNIYTTWGSAPTVTFRLYPAPYTNSNVRLFYSRLPVSLALDGSADSSNIDFPEGYIELLYDYCELRALRKDRDPRWQENKQLFEEAVAHMQFAAQSYIRDTYEIISETSYGDSSYWFLMD